jgi:hypothetical protein
MENNDYQSVRKNAKDLYSKIGKVWCPTLNGYVYFNHAGFRHLLRKRGYLREEKEQIRRFSLLDTAKTIIEDPSVRALYSPKKTSRRIAQHGKKITEHTLVDFWMLNKPNNKSAIKVIVRKMNHGRMHFFSVY